MNPLFERLFALRNGFDGIGNDRRDAAGRFRYLDGETLFTADFCLRPS